MDRRETTSSDFHKVSTRGTALVTPSEQITKQSSPKKTALVIFGTIADTTWRLFAPVIGLLLVGIWLDGKAERAPLFALSGILLGCVLAFLLVRLQYKQVTGDDN